MLEAALNESTSKACSLFAPGHTSPRGTHSLTWATTELWRAWVGTELPAAKGHTCLWKEGNEGKRVRKIARPLGRRCGRNVPGNSGCKDRLLTGSHRTEISDSSLAIRHVSMPGVASVALIRDCSRAGHLRARP